MPKFSNEILESLRDSDGRHSFMQSMIAKNISAQIKQLRHDRPDGPWTQTDLARTSGKPQSVISRIESSAYGKLTLKTIYDIGRAFDVAVLIRYVSFADFIRSNADLSWKALSCKPYEEQDLTFDKLYGSQKQLLSGMQPSPNLAEHAPPSLLSPSPGKSDGEGAVYGAKIIAIEALARTAVSEPTDQRRPLASGELRNHA